MFQWYGVSDELTRSLFTNVRSGMYLFESIEYQTMKKVRDLRRIKKRNRSDAEKRFHSEKSDITYEIFDMVDSEYKLLLSEEKRLEEIDKTFLHSWEEMED